MYVTRPLSLHRKSPESLSLLPEGPNSGYLVINDEESPNTCCFRLWKEQWISDFPFPQNKRILMNQPVGDHSQIFDAYLMPVINQPLSSNRYYAIKPSGSHKGEAYVSLKDEDRGGCWCCCKFIKNAEPRPLDPLDVDQQFEFSRGEYCVFANTFSAQSVAPDSYPPAYLRTMPWNAYTRDIKNCSLGEALGVDISLRAQLLELNSIELVGKWYCPFMFIKDMSIKEQVESSLFYEMTLERRWQRVFTCENRNGLAENSVTMDIVVETEGIAVFGSQAAKFETHVIDGVVWFNAVSGDGNELPRIGLSWLIVERMIWEQERVGWDRDQKQARLMRTEKYEGIRSVWLRFECYVLVERFVLKRMDGLVVLAYDFKHTNEVKSKWE